MSFFIYRINKLLLENKIIINNNNNRIGANESETCPSTAITSSYGYMICVYSVRNISFQFCGLHCQLYFWECRIRIKSNLYQIRSQTLFFEPDTVVSYTLGRLLTNFLVVWSSLVKTVLMSSPYFGKAQLKKKCSHRLKVCVVLE